MFTTFTKTICSLIITLTIATSAQAQLSSAFGSGNPGTSERPTGQVQPSSKNSSSPILGAWRTQIEADHGLVEIIYAFQQDGTMALGVQTTPPGGQPNRQTFEGRYQSNGQQLNIKYNDGDVENFQVSQNGSALSLSSSEGSYQLTRVTFNQPSPSPSKDVRPAKDNGNRERYAGHWKLFAQENGTTVQGSMKLDANGAYELSLSVKENGNNSQTSLSGRWKMEPNTIVFKTDGEIERYPMQFDGQRLAIDLAEWGCRTVFALDVNKSSVEPLTPQAQSRGGGVPNNTYRGGQPYQGDMTNRF